MLLISEKLCELRETLNSIEDLIILTERRAISLNYLRKVIYMHIKRSIVNENHFSIGGRIQQIEEVNINSQVVHGDGAIGVEFLMAELVVVREGVEFS